jgi:hypothetical protein
MLRTASRPMRLGLLFAWWGLFPAGCLGLILSFNIVGHLSGPTYWTLTDPTRCALSIGALAVVLIISTGYMIASNRGSRPVDCRVTRDSPPN